MRRATPEEAKKAGYCVVCADLYEGQHGRPPWPDNDERLGSEHEQLRLNLADDAAVIAMLADFFAVSPASDAFGVGQ